MVPSPYTRPHPPVFVATAGTPESAEYAASRGFIPLYFTCIDTALTLGNAYSETHRLRAARCRFGQNQAVVRMPHIGDTMEKAQVDNQVRLRHLPQLLRRDGPAHGRDEGRRQSDDQVRPVGGRHGREVRAKLVEEYKKFPAEYLTLIYHYAQMPKEEVLRKLHTLHEGDQTGARRTDAVPGEPSVAAAGGGRYR